MLSDGGHQFPTLAGRISVEGVEFGKPAFLAGDNVVQLAQALQDGDLFLTKPTVLAEFSQRFHNWLDEARVEEKTRKNSEIAAAC